MDVTSRPLYLVAAIHPRPDRLVEVERELRTLMAGTHEEPGCLYMELVVEDVDPPEAPTWFMFEKFTSRSDWDEHMQTDHVKRGNERLVGLLREPTELRFFTDK